MGGISVGGEYQIFKDTENGKAYHGGTFLVGGASSFPVELHGEATYSKIIFSINVRELFKKIIIW